MGRQLIFDHFAIAVTNVAKSDRFYADVLGLKRLDRPAFDFGGSWFELLPDVSIHLIEQQEIVIASHSRAFHFAFQVSDLATFHEQFGQPYPWVKPPKYRPDGYKHAFIQDPDGYFIELVEIAK